MNRRRYDNVIHVFPIFTWVLVISSACLGGLYFVDCKVKAHKRAEKIQALEKQISELQLADVAVCRQIEKLASPVPLNKQRHTEKGFLADFVDVTPDHLVIISESPGPVSGLRKVSNERRE